MAITCTIWKFPVMPSEIKNYKFTISMPQNSHILSVHEQNNMICLWAQVNPQNVKKNYHFFIAGTGNDLSKETFGDFIGTVHLFNGTEVMHIFHG